MPDASQAEHTPEPAMYIPEHDNAQDVQLSSNDGYLDETFNDTPNGDGPSISDNAHSHSMDFRSDMMSSWTEENAASLFFDPSLNIPDPSLDFEWLFEDISTGFDPSADLPAMVSPESSISASNISPPSFPTNAPQMSSYSPTQPSAPWEVVQRRLLDAMNTLSPEIFMSTFFYPSNLSYFYDLYFGNYHPHFPIIHKPTLDPTKASPLLMAAILSLGSTLSSDVAHFETSVKIHDSLRYIIFNVRSYHTRDKLRLVLTTTVRRF